MKPEDIILIKELIKEAVENAIEKSGIKKDLKEAKALSAGVLKHLRENTSPIVETHTPEVSKEIKDKIRKAVISEDFQQRPSKAPMPLISAERAIEISTNGTLPDIDAPIPFIDKKNPIWMAMKERIS